MKYTIVMLLITLMAISMSSCKGKTTNKTVMNILKSNKKYDFNIAACAPNLYPAEVIDGAFSLADGSSQYIPSGAVLKTGWGGLAPTHASGPDLKALPTGFNITWVSYVEKKFYRGIFQLDTELVSNLFKNGFENELNENKTYDEIKVGVAPGGVVVVWLNGEGTQIEVGRFIAKSIEITKEYFIPNATISVNEYIEETLKEDLPEQYQNSTFTDNIPFGLWDTYRKKYTWKPKIAFANDNTNVVSMVIYHYNGEKIYTHANNKELTDFKDRAIPKYLSIVWKDKNDNLFGSRIKFGSIYENDLGLEDIENEIFNSFKTLFKDTKQVELLVKIDKYNSHAKVFITNEKDTIELTKPIIKTFMKTKK